MTGQHFNNHELNALRNYVTHDSGSLNKADSTVLLMCTHSNLKARFMELRFDRYVRPRPPHANHATAVPPPPSLSSHPLTPRQTHIPSSGRRSQIWTKPQVK